MREPPVSLEVEMKCANWGCDRTFFGDRNTKKECQYHWGKFEFGSERGLWPGGWTCCRSAYDEPGCRFGIHRGFPITSQIKQCINHGEQHITQKKNKRTGEFEEVSTYPDSFCGKSFIYNAKLRKGHEDDENN